jgi:ABC-type uncharacterized transport system involved in gliding motility auxiliary subunit
MNNQNNPYLKIPLWVAWLGLLALVLAGLVRGTMALGMYTPENPDTLNLILSISAAVTVLGFAAYAMLNPEAILRFLGGRQARYGSNALIMILAFIGIIVAANMLAINAPKDQLVDLSEDKSNTLAPETISVLKSLPQKLSATGFFSSQYPTDEAEKLLSNMQANSEGKFSYRFIDPVSNPIDAKNAGVTGDGKIALKMGERSEIADYADETEMLRAINRLLNPEERTVYFITGHGERSIDTSGTTGLSRAKETLENKNYTVKSLNLLADNKIPADARVVIIVGPTKPLTAAEVGLLNKYVQGGGSLIVMEDPVPLTDFGEASDPLADSLARVWGITLRNDFVLDDNSSTPQNAIGANYSASHPITGAMTAATIFPLARSIAVQPSGELLSISELVQTSSEANSWGETDFSALEADSAMVSLDPEVDTPGPVTLVASVEDMVNQGRIVVFGNSLFVSDDGFDAYGNGDLFVASVDWGAGDDAPVDITITPPTERTFLPPGGLTLVAILLGSACIIPGLVLGAGVATWAARKRRG